MIAGSVWRGALNRRLTGAEEVARGQAGIEEAEAEQVGVEQVGTELAETGHPPAEDEKASTPRGRRKGVPATRPRRWPGSHTLERVRSSRPGYSWGP